MAVVEVKSLTKIFGKKLSLLSKWFVKIRVKMKY